MGDVKHCPTCGTEYMPTALRCADCDVELASGPPPAHVEPVRSASAVPGAPATEADEPDTYFATLPGQQADYLTQALTEAGIFSLLICEGQRKLYGPELPSGPMAVTLPVEIHVPAAHLSEVREIIESITHDGEIVHPLSVNVDETAWQEHEVAPEPEAEPPTVELDRDDTAISEPTPESNTGRILLILAVAVVLMLLLFARR